MKSNFDTDFFIQEPANVYHKQSEDYLSSHRLGSFHRAPREFQWLKDKKMPARDSSAYDMGTMTHALILEGLDAYKRLLPTCKPPINPKTDKPYGPTAKDYKEWRKEQYVKKRIILNDKETTDVLQMGVAVQEHAGAQELLSEGLAEGVLRLNYNGFPCQIRCDWFNPALGLVDLKTCSNLTFFTYDFKKYGYAYQMAFYRTVLKEQLGQNVPVHVIAVEKIAPYRVGVFNIHTDVLDIAEQANRNAMYSMAQCAKTNIWPTGYEETRTIETI